MKKFLLMVAALAVLVAACAPTAAPAAQTATGPKANPTIRDLAWQPGLYVGKTVTVTGAVVGTPGSKVDRHQEPGVPLVVTERMTWYFRGPDGDTILVTKEARKEYPEGTRVMDPGLVEVPTAGSTKTLTGVWTEDEMGWYLLVK